MNKTNLIFSILTVFVLMAISFFAGATVEKDSHVSERDSLNEDLIAAEGLNDHFIYNADWNALKNMEINY